MTEQEAQPQPETSTEVAVKDEELTPAQIAMMQELADDTKGEIDLQQDVNLPALALVQRTSKGVGSATPGQIRHTLTEEALSKAEVVLVRMYRTRAYWGVKDTLGGAPPACNSQNAIEGWGDPSEEDMKRDDPSWEAENRQPEPYGIRLGIKGPNGGGSCKDCPKNRFGKNACQLQYNYLGILVSPVSDNGTTQMREFKTELPVGFMMKRTSIKKATQLNSLLLNMKFPWSNVIELGGEIETNKAGQEYFVWTVKKGRATTTEEMLRAAEVAGMVRDAQQRGALVTIDDPQQETASAPVGSAGDEDIPF